MTPLLLVALVISSAFATCPLNRPLKIKMYQFIADPAGDWLAGLTTYLQNQFFAATGCEAVLDFGWDVNMYDARQVKRALKPCSVANPLPQCGYDMVEIDAVVLDDLVDTPDLIQPMPAAVTAHFHEFMQQARKMVKQGGVQWAQPSYACDNLLMTYETGLEEVGSIGELLDWTDSKLAGNTSRLGWTGDMWAVWDLTTIYVDAHLDTHPNRPLCCGANSAYDADVSAPIARKLADLVGTCQDNPATQTQGHIVNNCLNNVFYNDYNAWFGAFLSGRSVMIGGFSSYLSNIREMGGSYEGLTIVSAPYGDGNRGYMFTDAFTLSKANCPDTGCVDAAALWLNWQRLEGQIAINLGKDLTPPRPRYLVSANEEFYADSRIAPYTDIYDIFFNDQGTGTLQVAIPLNTKDYTDNYCDQYADLTTYINTGSSCAAQGKANQE